MKYRWKWVAIHLVVALVFGIIHEDKSSTATYLGIIALLKAYGV